MGIVEKTWDSASSAFTSVSGRSSWTSSLSVMDSSATTRQTNAVRPISACTSPELDAVLKQYISVRCTVNEYCCAVDFDDSAMEALRKMPILQSLQTVEHYSSSVSKRIHKKAAYLMGILHGQQTHWEKMILNNNLSNNSNNMLNSKENQTMQQLELSEPLMLYVGRCCLSGNCLPSDFTPDVCYSLQKLPLNLGVKAVGAFNTNKRIVAGAKGGVINRSRFFLRLIQNVTEQSQSQPTTPRSSVSSTEIDDLCSKFTMADFNSTPKRTSVKQPQRQELNLEELASLDFSSSRAPSPTPMVATVPPVSYGISDEERIKLLQREIVERRRREEMLLVQMSRLEQRLYALQGECVDLKMRLDLSYKISNKDVLF